MKAPERLKGTRDVLSMRSESHAKSLLQARIQRNNDLCAITETIHVEIDPSPPAHLTRTPSMPPLFEVLFLFSAPQGYLAEVMRLDLPAETAKDQLFH
jgi:hypothetical protein